MYAGQGKTQVIGHLVQSYVDQNKKTCVVVPNELLRLQVVDLFELAFPSTLVSVLTADRLTSYSSYDIYIYDEADDLISNYMLGTM